MCLAIPGQVLSVDPVSDPWNRTGKVLFGTIEKTINLAYAPDAEIGDFVLACDAFWDIRRAFPEARITLVCDPAIAVSAASLGIFDEVVAFQFFSPRGMGGPGPLYVDPAAFAGRITGRHDLAIDLRHDAETRPLLAHVDARIRAGYEAPGFVIALDFVMPRFPDVPSRLGQRHAVHAATRMRLLVQALVETLAGSREPGAIAAATAPSPGRSDYFAMAPGRNRHTLLAGRCFVRWMMAARSK